MRKRKPGGGRKSIYGERMIIKAVRVTPSQARAMIEKYGTFNKAIQTLVNEDMAHANAN